MQTEIIHNPITGETLYVLESSEEVFRFEYAIKPGGEIAAEHIHPDHEQRVSVVEGMLRCRVGTLEHRLRAGESAVIPPGVAHFQSNPTDLESRAIEEYRPAGRSHDFFRVAFALARDGHTDANGLAKPLIGAALLAEFAGFVRPTSPYLRFLFLVLGPVSKLLGHRRVIRKYIERFEREDLHRTPVISFDDTPAAKHATGGQTI